MSNEELLERIANLFVAETPVAQIAMVTGLEIAEVTQLKETPECKRQIAIIMAENIEDAQNLNSGWDAVETTAIGIVIDNLKWNKDPRFALAAAAQANKAVRRGRAGNHALNATNEVRAVINLQMNFIDHLQKATHTTSNTTVELERKMVDCMEPTKIEKLLEGPEKQTEDADNILPGFEMAAMLNGT